MKQDALLVIAFSFIWDTIPKGQAHPLTPSLTQGGGKMGMLILY